MSRQLSPLSYGPTETWLRVGVDAVDAPHHAWLRISGGALRAELRLFGRLMAIADRACDDTPRRVNPIVGGHDAPNLGWNAGHLRSWIGDSSASCAWKHVPASSAAG